MMAHVRMGLRMTRPILWAAGTLVTACIGAVSASDRIAAKFGLGTPQAQLAAHSSQKLQGPQRIEVSADLQGHFVVHPTLDGKRVRMLVDTGASVVVLSHEDARLVGVSVRPGDYTRRIATANGIVQAAPVRFPEVRVGDIVVRSVEGLVMPPGKLGTSLLGMSFLKRLGGFEIAQGRLILKG
jgi:aspartyl protease family protein